MLFNIDVLIFFNISDNKKLFLISEGNVTRKTAEGFGKFYCTITEILFKNKKIVYIVHAGGMRLNRVCNFSVLCIKMSKIKLIFPYQSFSSFDEPVSLSMFIMCIL